jgi:hypothetical protein
VLNLIDLYIKAKDSPVSGNVIFFSLFWTAWGKAFTELNIKSGFKSTGLSPFNPDSRTQREVAGLAARLLLYKNLSRNQTAGQFLASLQL